jgi:hypothetical protein
MKANLKMLDEAPARADGKVPIFTKYITLKDGRRIYAASKGLDAFCIWVKPR